MAQQQQYVLLLIIASLVLSAQAQVGQLLNVVSIIGDLCCTPNGSCDVPGALPLAGVDYTVTCAAASLGSTVAVGRGTTTPSGGINITVPLPTPVTLLAAASASVTIIPCNVTFPLPLSSAICPVLSTTTGILTGAIQLVGTTVSTLFGLIANTVVTVFFVLVV